tara:strand:- start:17513 stop:18409 length:897 start_codon:yes stop_codon:yes gene_type:complete
MNKSILVAGATGNLGMRICRELLNREAIVTAIVRPTTAPQKIEALSKMGVLIQKVDLNSTEEIADACEGKDLVVSALSGLEDVIVDLQKRILDAALKAKVKRFIPSYFCTDYTDLLPGENRNFDLRRVFRTYLDSTSIQASSVFNGAFADILQYDTPVLNRKELSIGYWGDKADWKLDFTTMDDTAAFTAEVALDDEAPRDLQIASFQISPNMLQDSVKELTGKSFNLRLLSSMENFAVFIKKQRADNPAGEMELYAKWQQSQYMYSMFSTQHQHLAYRRYENLTWTSALTYLQSFLR